MKEAPRSAGLGRVTGPVAGYHGISDTFARGSRTDPGS